MATAILKPILRKAPTPYEGFDPMPIHGEWRAGRSGQTAVDVNPDTNDVIVTIPLADEREVDEAYRAAAAAQRDWSDWRPAERSAVLRRAAAVMEARRDATENLEEIGREILPRLEATQPELVVHAV